MVFYNVDGRHKVLGSDADLAGYNLPLLHTLADGFVDVGYYVIGWTVGTVILYFQAFAQAYGAVALPGFNTCRT